MPRAPHARPAESDESLEELEELSLELSRRRFFDLHPRVGTHLHAEHDSQLCINLEGVAQVVDEARVLAHVNRGRAIRSHAKQSARVGRRSAIPVDAVNEIEGHAVPRPRRSLCLHPTFRAAAVAVVMPLLVLLAVALAFGALLPLLVLAMLHR